jgi:phytoene dehydrogenase-like protein
MITGVAAHAIVRQPSLAGRRPDSPCRPTHAGGWPIPLGGSQAISDALAVDLVAHGGEIVTDHEVASLDELTARAVVLDVTPRALIRLAGRGRQPISAAARAVPLRQRRREGAVRAVRPAVGR